MYHVMYKPLENLLICSAHLPLPVAKVDITPMMNVDVA